MIDHHYTRADFEAMDADEAFNYSATLATLACHWQDHETMTKALDSMRAVYYDGTRTFGGMTVARVMFPTSVPDTMATEYSTLADSYKMHGMTTDEGQYGIEGTYVATWSLHS